jgi:hypothetical protein
MRQEPTDVSLDALLRTLELYYAYHAAGLLRANGIPEPLRLPDAARPESLARVDVCHRANVIQLSQSNRTFHNGQRKSCRRGPIPLLS